MHATQRTNFLALFFLLLCALQPASASIYPTLPVQGTVWTAGQSVLVTWAEDGLPPTVNVMGPVTIEIWANVNTYITTLASNVDPRVGSVQVTVPAIPGGNDQSNYTLHFVAHAPAETVIYSADFKIASTITANPTTNAIPASSAASVTSAPPTSTTTPISITPLTSSAPVTVTTATIPVVNSPVIILITSTSMVTPTLITLGNPPVSTVVAGSNASTANATTLSGTPHPQQLGSGKNAAGKSFDMEKVMFRVMFVIWPALVGIALTM
ncbi:hypothetical protein V8B97DRAFT_665337 [Scleroderma yunnanense]